jgi:hypothetical protein
VSEVAVTPDVERESDMDAWGLFLANRSVATEYFDTTDEAADEVQTFVSETAFEDGERIVYVRAYAPQTCYALRLKEDPFIDTNGLPVIRTEITRTAPVDLLLRLSFDPDGPHPSAVAVQVTGGDGNEQEGFQLEAER